MKEYEVWSEGYMATGEHGKAHLYGKVKAINFHTACTTLLGKKLDQNRDGSAKLSVWGCRLFDNEADARASFG